MCFISIYTYRGNREHNNVFRTEKQRESEREEKRVFSALVQPNLFIIQVQDRQVFLAALSNSDFVSHYILRTWVPSPHADSIAAKVERRQPQPQPQNHPFHIRETPQLCTTWMHVLPVNIFTSNFTQSTVQATAIERRPH